MAGFYSARGRSIPPILSSTFASPISSATSVAKRGQRLLANSHQSRYALSRVDGELGASLYTRSYENIIRKSGLIAVTNLPQHCWVSYSITDLKR